MKKIINTLLILLLKSSICLSQTIDGKITDGKSPIPFVNVIVKGTSIGSTTDFDGYYKISLPPGEYEIVSSFIGYETISKKIVTSDQNLKLDFKMIQSSIGLDHVNIVSDKTTNTENAVLSEMKRSSSVISGVSSQQIAKSQDRDASEVIKRIPGITIMNDRFVMVRGLSERYNSVFINGTTIPSTESDVKSFSFDMIPSQLIDRIIIYKSPSPEISGEFAGGVVKIFTKNVVDNKISFGYSTSYRVGTTFEEFYQDKGGKTDWLGFDDGGRSIPPNFTSNIKDITDKEHLSVIGRSLNNNWSPIISISSPDQRFNFLFSRKFNIKKLHISNITTINYSNSRQFLTSRRTDYNTYNEETGKSDTIYDYYDKKYTNSVKCGLMHNWSFIFLNSKIEFKNTFSQNGSNQFTLRDGKNFEEGEIRREYSYYYMDRSIYTGQLIGNHRMFEDRANLDWSISYSKSKKDEPDWRRARTAKDINSPNDPYQTYVPFGATPFFLGRLYFNLNEEIVTGYANIEQKITIGKFKPKLLAGLYLERKWRSFSARNLGYASSNVFQFDNSLRVLSLDQLFSEQNINSTTGIKIDEDTRKSDSYTAQNDLIAYYLAIDIPIKNINIRSGVRVENNRQRLESYTLTGNKINVDNHIIRALPSTNITYNVSKKMVVRGGFGITLNRPEFRELAPYAFYDFNFNSVNYGNDSLKTPKIYNYDIRYEFYPSANEVISFGGFYKNFINPIETYFVPGTGSGGTRNYTYRNAESSNSYGVEFDARKSIFRNFGLTLNASYIWSNVNLGKKSQGQSEKRPMMGQSPYIVNGGIYYQNDSIGLQCSILYNVIGPRIFIVGSYGTPDVYEMPRNSLDISVSKILWKKLEIKIGVQDLLNQKYLLSQDANMDGKITINDQQIQSYKRGSYYSIGIGFKF